MEVNQLLSVFTQNAELLEFALSKLPEAEKAVLLDAVGMELLDRFEQDGSTEDLGRAITMAEQAVEGTPRDHPDRAGRLNNLGMALQSRFEITGSMDDLHRAIVTKEHALELTPDDHPDRGAMLTNLGVALHCRFERTGSMDDLDRGILTNEQAVKSTSENHPDRPAMLNNFGNALQRRFERTGSMDDLDRAIMMKEEALKSTQNEDPARAGRLNSLGIALRSRFERTGSMDDIDRAIVLNEQAVTSTPENRHHARYLNNLGIALQTRFERTGSIDDLDRAIVTNKQAVESIPYGHPDRAMYLINLGSVLQRRFDQTRAIDDLDHAITVSGQALELTPLDHPDRVGRANNLGTALRRRFEWTGSIDDLNRAILTQEQAVESTPDDHPDRAIYLNNLGIALEVRFERTGSMDDLSRAILINEKAVISTPDNHPDRAKYLNNFGIVLHARFERTGSMNDLDRAILTKEQAVESTPNDHPERAGRLSNLGNALHRRFEQTGSMDDIDCAIMTQDAAIKLISENHIDYAAMMNNLGTALHSRFERTRSLDDLDRAIVTNELAVAWTPDNHPHHGKRLTCLGIVLRSRFERTGSMDDLNRAIVTNDLAVESTPDDDPYRAAMLNNLGIALLSRFNLTGSTDDLDRAIVTREQAVESTPDDHLDRAIYLNNLGNASRKRFERTGSMNDLARAIESWEQAFKCDTAPPSIRLQAASSCSDLLINQRLYNRAKMILQAAVRLLPMVSPRELKRNDQQFNISQFSDITSLAVSLSLADGEDSYDALQSLELGRGIIANLHLEVRSDISVLAVSHPNLARQFQDLRARIDSHSTIPGSSFTLDSLPVPDSSIFKTDRRAMIKRFEELLECIRCLDGFDNFLRGPSKSELHSLAEAGPIVVFNVSHIRSDAILITTDDIRSVHLPLLTSDALEDRATRFLSAVNDKRSLSQYNHARVEVNTILEWLWDAVVKPVLDELGFTQMPLIGEVSRRIWWVGSGLLNILPIHASGYHDSTPPIAALDRVISSYAPTIKSLSYARERLVRVEQLSSKEKAILVVMPTTPGKGSLPNVEKEIKGLENLFSMASIDSKIKRNPTRQEVLFELPKYSIVHFACHGYPATDPSQSSLLLEDWKTVPLTVSDLTSLDIDLAKFAYLSACHTSVVRDISLLDESIALTSAVQLSGYPSVVGTLWQVMDEHSVKVAKDVYTWSLDGNGRLDARRSAEGLHKAVRDLRDKTRIFSRYRSDPLIWAPYVHIGV